MTSADPCKTAPTYGVDVAYAMLSTPLTMVCDAAEAAHEPGAAGRRIQRFLSHVLVQLKTKRRRGV
jgi:hypothetical protein